MGGQFWVPEVLAHGVLPPKRPPCCAKGLAGAAVGVEGWVERSQMGWDRRETLKPCGLGAGGAAP